MSIYHIYIYIMSIYHIYIYTSSTRTRWGGSCLKDIYKTFLIYRTCMRRAPAKPVRACTLRNWCRVSHVTLEASRHTSHLTVFTLHTALFTPHTSHCTLHTPHFISSELFSPYPSSALLISSLLMCHLSFHESLPSTTTNRCRSLDASTPIRFTIFSCKRQ